MLKLYSRLLSVTVLFALSALPASRAQDAVTTKYQMAADYSEKNGGFTVLVMVDGKVVFERYANAGNANKLHGLASGTKSFVGVVAMAAVEDGIIRLDDKVSETLTE